MGLNAYETELSKRYLIDFTQLTMPKFSPGWFHNTYYDILDDFSNRKIKKLMIFMPPQHGKSEGSTRRLPAKLIGNNPNEKIAIVSYSASKARKFNREIQRVISDPTYTQIFPEIRLSNGADGYTKSFDEFEIVGFEGGIKTVGVGGALTGDPVDTLIMDDLYKGWAEAQSDVIRESIQDWYDSVADTRLHNNSRQLIVFTRWHEKDVAGYLLEKEPEEWTVISFPAIQINEPTALDPRKIGEPLWPERHSLEKLLKTKTRNPHNFESLYQQNPKPKEGLLFPEDELTFLDAGHFPEPEFKAAAVDPADEGGDDLAAPYGYLSGNKIYIKEIIFNKDGTDVNLPNVVDMILRNKINHTTVEGNSAWRIFGKQIRQAVTDKNDSLEIRIINNTAHKHTRILAQAAFIRNHFVFRKDYKEIPEYYRFMQQLTSYLKIGKAKHEDAPDSLAELAKYYNTNFEHVFYR